MTTTVTLTAGSSRKIASALKLPKPHACHPLFLKATGRATGRAIGTVTFSSKEILNSITAHSQNFGSKLTVVRNLVMCLVSRSKDSLRALTAIRFCTTKTTTRNMSQTDERRRWSESNSTYAKREAAAKELASLYGAALKTLPLYPYSPGQTTLSQASIRPSLSVASSHEEPPMRVDLRPLSP